VNRDIAAATTEATASGAGSAQAPWRAGRAPAGGKLERWVSRGVTCGQGRAGGVDDGGQGWCAAPTAGGTRSRAEGRGARRKKGYELNQGLICKIREK
jgi:hypothetical protein